MAVFWRRGDFKTAAKPRPLGLSSIKTALAVAVLGLGLFIMQP
jgi:hypothetical protein